MSIFNSYVELLEGMCFMVTSQLLVAIIPDLCGQTPPGHFWLKPPCFRSKTHTIFVSTTGKRTSMTIWNIYHDIYQTNGLITTSLPNIYISNHIFQSLTFYLWQSYYQVFKHINIYQPNEVFPYISILHLPSCLQTYFNFRVMFAAAETPLQTRARDGAAAWDSTRWCPGVSHWVLFWTDIPVIRCYRSLITCYSPIIILIIWILYGLYGLYLVGGFNHLEKYEFVNGKDDIPYMKWKI